MRPLRDPVVAQRALVDRLRARVDEAAAVGAGLHAVAAAEAVGLVDQHDAVRALEGRADGAHLHAGRVRAVVAQLRHEEALGAVALAVLLGEAVVAAVRRVDLRVLDVPVRHVVALDPGAEVDTGSRGTSFSSLHARTQLPQPMHCSTSIAIAHQWSAAAVVRRLLGLAARDRVPRDAGGARQQQEAARAGEELAAAGRLVAHLRGSLLRRGQRAPPRRKRPARRRPPRRAGRGPCGTWCTTRRPSGPAASICGNFAGRATLSWWQRAHSTFGSGFDRLAPSDGSSACFASGAVARLAAHAAVLAPSAARPTRPSGTRRRPLRPGVGERPRAVVVERAGAGSGRSARTPSAPAAPAAPGTPGRPRRTGRRPSRGAPCGRRDLAIAHLRVTPCGERDASSPRVEDPDVADESRGSK